MECRQKIESYLQANKSEGVIIRLLDIIIYLHSFYLSCYSDFKSKLEVQLLKKNPFKSTFPS